MDAKPSEQCAAPILDGLLDRITDEGMREWRRQQASRRAMEEAQSRLDTVETFCKKLSALTGIPFNGWSVGVLKALPDAEVADRLASVVIPKP